MIGQLECKRDKNEPFEPKMHTMVQSVDLYGNVIISCKLCGTAHFGGLLDKTNNFSNLESVSTD